MKKIIYYLMCTILMESCATTKLTGWDSGGKYQYFDENGNTIAENRKLNDPVDVSVSFLQIQNATVKEEEKSKNFFDLSEKVQERFLSTLNSNTKENKEILDVLKNDLYASGKKEENISLPTDYTKIKIRAVFSVIKKYYNDQRLVHPNTRLALLNTRMELDKDSPFYISLIDKIENEFEEIDMGTISRENSVAFKSSLEGSMGNTTNISDKRDTEDSLDDSAEDQETGSTTKNSKKSGSHKEISSETKNGASAKVSYDINDKINELVSVNLKRMTSGFSLEGGKKLTLMQQGSLNRDISNNTIVTMSISSTGYSDHQNVFRFEDLFINNKASSADKSKYSVRDIKFFRCSGEDLIFRVNYEGAIRSAKNRGNWLGMSQGRNNILEYDDKVSFYKIKSAKAEDSNKIKFKRKEFCKALANIKLIYNKSSAIFEVKTIDKATQVLFFEDYEQASIFINYLFSLLQEYKTTKNLSLFKTSQYKILFQGRTIIGDRPDEELIKNFIEMNLEKDISIKEY